MIAMKKKPETTKCSIHRTVSLITHNTPKIARILTRRVERKMEDVLGKDQFGCKRTGTRDASGMLRII